MLQSPQSDRGEPAACAQTRGFLFSDLRGYSAYTERDGDRGARELLTRYRRVVREAIATFGGAEIRTEGDSFYIVFDSVSAAVEAGSKRAPPSTGRVRAGSLPGRARWVRGSPAGTVGSAARLHRLHLSVCPFLSSGKALPETATWRLLPYVA